MDTPLVTQEQPKEHIVLIVDKNNEFANDLAVKIESHATIVLVSEEKPESTSLIHIPYTKRVPEIPVGTYSHIFLFSEEQAEHDLLLPMAEKANTDNARFVYAIPYWLYNPQVSERLASLCRNWVLVLVGDIFDEKNATSHIGQIVHQAKLHKSISLPDLGLETVRPVAFSDVIDSLLRVGFGLEKQHICFIFSKHPYTALSVVHGLQKIDPLLRIDFVTHQSSYPNPLLPEGVHLLESDYPALKKIQDMYGSFEGKKEGRGEKASLIVSKKTKGNSMWRLSVISFFVGFLFFLALPLIWTLSTAGLGEVLFNNAKTQLEKGSFQEAQKYAHASEVLLSWSEMGSTVVVWEANCIGQANTVQEMSLQIHSMDELSQIVTEIAQAGQSFQQVADGKTRTSQATFTDGTIALKNALLTLQGMTYLPKNVQEGLLPLQPLVTLVAQTIDISPTLFGLDKPKTYLLLLQNNADLRPGGGIIDSYAIVKVANGKIGAIDIHKVSDADEQLKGHVEPPFVVRRYLQKEHWYLQDSNFSSDNLKNAQTEAFFIQQELGVRVDGVITLDMDFIKNILAVVGNIYLPEYSQTVRSDNFLTLLQAHEVNEATQVSKNDFLPILLTALQKKIQSNEVSYTLLGKQLADAFVQKHLMTAFPDVTLQQLFTVNNMSSALWDPRKNDGNVVNDFTGISETNLGLNQANQFIKRSVMQSMVLNASGTISGTLTIHYDNTGESSAVYKNYLRTLLPSGAQITNISLNNIPQSRFPAVIDPAVYGAKNFKTPKGIEVEHTQENGKEEYGFLVTVPTDAMLDVAIAYTLSQKFDLSQTTSTFDELLFKQPGTETDSYTFTLSYPSFLTLITGPKGMEKSTSKVVVSMPLARDTDYQFTFTNQ